MVMLFVMFTFGCQEPAEKTHETETEHGDITSGFAAEMTVLAILAREDGDEVLARTIDRHTRLYADRVVTMGKNCAGDGPSPVPALQAVNLLHQLWHAEGDLLAFEAGEEPDTNLESREAGAEAYESALFNLLGGDMYRREVQAYADRNQAEYNAPGVRFVPARFDDALYVRFASEAYQSSMSVRRLVYAQATFDAHLLMLRRLPDPEERAARRATFMRDVANRCSSSTNDGDCAPYLLPD